jgi:putative spermidine/putrescine transport system permease protein
VLFRDTRRFTPLLLALLVAAPVLLGVLYAALASLGLAGAGASGTPDLSRVFTVLGTRSTWRAVGWSVYVSATATALATVAAAAVAIVFGGHRRIDRAARALATLPLPVPHLVAAATALLLLSQSGLLARLLFAMGLIDAPAAMPALVYDRVGVGLILALAWKELPFLTVVAVAVRHRDLAALTEAARTLGADRWQQHRRITWPLLWRGMAPAVIAVFAFALGSYETAALLAPVDPAPLAVLTMERFADPALARRGDAYVLALIGLTLAAMAVAAHEWARARWTE